MALSSLTGQGSSCNYYHRLPSQADEEKIGFLYDCFGRERHATDRDDMTGVGSFVRNCKTLYISGLKSYSGINYDDVLTRHFGEWGQSDPRHSKSKSPS